MPLHATDERARTFRNLSGQERKFYVRPNGNDSNSGESGSNAFLTMARALHEIEKDYYNGYYTIDITGCTFNEKIQFPQVRAESTLKSDYNNGLPIDEYGSRFRSSVNIRALPTVVSSLNGCVDTGEILAPTVHRLTLAGAAWAPASLMDHFVDGGPGTTRLPIVGNGADWIDVLFPINGGITPTRLVKNSATFIGDEEAKLVFDGLVAGYIVTGVNFDQPADQALVVQNASTVAFEYGYFPNGRIRVGGAGMPRFYLCRLNEGESTRMTGGSVMFKGCVGTFLGWGNADNAIGDIISGVPVYATIDECYGAIGYLDGSNYDVTVRCMNSVLDCGYRVGGRLILEGGHYSNLDFSCGGVGTSKWCTLTNIIVRDGARLYNGGSTFGGTITVDGVTTNGADFAGRIDGTTGAMILNANM